ncbi:MAG: hypothetical protein GQ546_09160 [Gammaproteobacteria bacterium]|nr:hypothetical protein [Gammaproteobacteria bacterium]
MLKTSHKNDLLTIPSIPQQKGVALAVSLIFLLILTILSVSAVQNSTLETKIAVNHQHKQMSFQTAESALARVLGPDADIKKPLVVGAAAVDNINYYACKTDFKDCDFKCTNDFSDCKFKNRASERTTLSSNLKMEYIERSVPGKYKFSGYSLDIVTLVYEAEAKGQVNGTGATSTNRMEIALIRE